MHRNNQVQMIDPAALPDFSDAVHQFESYGGQLTLFSGFGDDPLKDNAPKMAQRETEFKQRYADFSQFFYSVVNSDYHLFKQGLLFYIHLSTQLARS